MRFIDKSHQIYKYFVTAKQQINYLPFTGIV